MTVRLTCPNCFAPLPAPVNGIAVCGFCQATSVVDQPPAAQAAPAAALPPDPKGALALAMDFEAEHGVSVKGDGNVMSRLGTAWSLAPDVRRTGRATINCRFLTATSKGPLHYTRDVDKATLSALLARVP